MIWIALSALLLLAAVLAFFRIDRQALRELRQERREHMQKSSLYKLTKIKKKSRFLRLLDSTTLALRTMGYLNGIYLVLFCSAAFATAGALWGLTLPNSLLTPVLAAACAGVPFLYVRLQYLSYKQIIFSAMETALSVVTSSYERTENILAAFQENLENIPRPLDVVFKQFAVSVEHLGKSLPDALEEMKGKLNQPIFSEWIDNLKNCARDRSLKVSLRPTVNKFSDINIASHEARTILYEVRSEYWIVLLLALVFLAVTYLFLPGVFQMELAGFLPDLLFAVNIVLILYSSVKAILMTKDLKFD